MLQLSTGYSRMMSPTILSSALGALRFRLRGSDTKQQGRAQDQAMGLGFRGLGFKDLVFRVLGDTAHDGTVAQPCRWPCPSTLRSV